jgi:hypothetical protein
MSHHPIKRDALNKPNKGSEWTSGSKLHNVAKRCPMQEDWSEPSPRSNGKSESEGSAWRKLAIARAALRRIVAKCQERKRRATHFMDSYHLAPFEYEAERALKLTERSGR